MSRRYLAIRIAKQEAKIVSGEKNLASRFERGCTTSPLSIPQTLDMMMVELEVFSDSFQRYNSTPRIEESP
jgi:hypothetical protein